MNKIKLLLVFTIGLATLYGSFFVSSIFGHNIYQYFEKETLKQQIVFIFLLLSEIITFLALILISMGLIKIVRSEIFDSGPSKFLKIGGFLFILILFCDLIYVLDAMFSDDHPILWIQRVFTNFLLFALGLISLIVSDVLIKGSLIKKENDLTI